MAWDPDTYRATIRDEVHDYDTLQHEVAKATVGRSRSSILDLGVGSGETAGRVLELHPGARLVGIDSSAEMLGAAAIALPLDRVTLVKQDLDAPLPDQGFDLVISALAIHHLEGDRKAGLFREVRHRLVADGYFVTGDVIVPEDPADALIEIEPGYDFPSSLEDQLRWMEEAGFSAEVVWRSGDLAVVGAEPAGSPS